MKHDIEAYLDGTLPLKARAEFEAQLARDAALRDAVDAARRMRNDLSWLAVEKGIQAAEQAFWKKQTARRRRGRWMWPALGLALLLIAVILWRQRETTPPPAAPEQQQQQPGPQTIPPPASDPVAQPTPSEPNKQADDADDAGRLFAAYFQPYKDPSLEPSRRGAAEPLPAERFQQLYWEDKHREALLAFDTLYDANKNNDNFLFLKANCLLATGRANESAALLETILRNDRTRFMAEARWYLALSYWKAGQTAQAKNQLRTIAADPQSPRRPDAERLLEQWK